MKLFKTLIIIITLFTGKNCFSQQETQQTQYMFNMSSINAGATAIDNKFKLYGSARVQWASVEGSPRTQYLSVESPINLNNLSLGVNITNDAIGPLTETELVSNIAYQVPIDKYRKIALGVRFGVRSFNIDWSKGEHQFDDPLFSENIQKYVMSMGFGLYYQGKHLFGGMSTNNLSIFQISSKNRGIEIPQYNFLVGYDYEINEEFDLKPILYVRHTAGAPKNIEFSTTVTYLDKLFGGFAYRYQNAFALLAGLNITPEIKLGYSYDVAIADTSLLGTGSHEILFTYTFKNKKYKREVRY